MRSGIGNLYVDDVTLTSTPRMKNSSELYAEWMRTSTTTTTTLSTTATTGTGTSNTSSTTDSSNSTTSEGEGGLV